MRLIDADALLDKTIFNPRHAPYVMALDIRFAPTIDAVPVVRCKDCKWFRDSNGIDGFCYCDRIYRRCGTHWFCADGEMRESE